MNEFLNKMFKIILIQSIYLLEHNVFIKKNSKENLKNDNNLVPVNSCSRLEHPSPLLCFKKSVYCVCCSKEVWNFLLFLYYWSSLWDCPLLFQKEEALEEEEEEVLEKDGVVAVKVMVAVIMAKVWSETIFTYQSLMIIFFIFLSWKKQFW